MNTTTLTVTGMTCGHCEKAVERAIKQLDPAAEVKAVIDGFATGETSGPVAAIEPQIDRWFGHDRMQDIVAALQARRIPVTYVLYPDEGHGFARPENRIAFNAVAEAFLAHCLGGRCEPIGEDLRGSSLMVPAGAEVLPGLAAALEGVAAWH